MKASSVPVEAQWALQAKTLGRDAYRVLACSAGSLSVEHFTEAIGRFTMGTPEALPNALPQVTISYLTLGITNHLALAIHRLASDAHPDGQLATHDDDGRPVVATSYYCVPYASAAGRSVSYRGMYEAFSAAPLHPENGPVLRVELPAAPDPGIIIDPLAAQAAALLATGRPVCVLGASLQTSMTDRLGFIDTVMSLLPYGFRARMTAATWTRATNQNHRFRLFFSGARRDVKEPDRVVYWGQPEQTTLDRTDTYAQSYYNWLSTGPVTEKQSLLSGLKNPRSLANRHEVLEALDAIDETTPVLMPLSRRRRSFLPRTISKPDPEQKGSETGPGPAQPARDTAAPARSEAEQLLMDCARHMETPDPRQLGDAIGRLKRLARSGVAPDERDRCRELIREHRLFRHHGALGRDEDMLRESLLKIAFAEPLSYEDYCLIEDGVGEAEAPDSSLLQLIEKQGTADDRVKAITYRQLPRGDAEKKLSRWYASKELSAYLLLNLLALEVKRPRHLRLLCEVTTDYLGKMSRAYDPKDIDRVLRQHSYLARQLQDSKADDNQFQLDTLGTFLRAAYPNGLTRQDLYHVMYHVMIGTNGPVTLPFLWAVHLTLADPADAFLARELYVHSLLETTDLEAYTTRELERLMLPVLKAHQPEAPALDRKVPAPLPPLDDPLGDQRAGANPPLEGNAQQLRPGKHRASPSRISNDDQ